MKQDRSKSIENKEIPTFIKNVKERLETSIQHINLAHTAEEYTWKIVLEEAIFYYILFEEDQTNTYPVRDYSEFKNLLKKTGESVYNKDYLANSYNSRYNTLYVQLQNIMQQFSVLFEQIFHKQSAFQLNSKQYRFIYELLARRNNIFVWRLILKEYNFSYNGFLDLYYKIDDDDRMPLINELKFIVEGISSIKEPSGLPAKEFKNHLLAVTQLPLIEIVNSSREIIPLNMQEVSEHPKAPELLEWYNLNLLKLNQEIKEAIDWANRRWLATYDSYQRYNGNLIITEDENGKAMFGIAPEEEEVDPTTEKLMNRLLEHLKKEDPRYSEVTTLDEFYRLNAEIQAKQTNTKNKKIDNKVNNLIMEFCNSLTDDEQLKISSMLWEN